MIATKNNTVLSTCQQTGTYNAADAHCELLKLEIIKTATRRKQHQKTRKWNANISLMTQNSTI